MRTSPLSTHAKRDVILLFLGLFAPVIMCLALMILLLPEQPNKELYAFALSLGISIIPAFVILTFWARVLRAEQLSTTDALSGLFNRHGAREAIEMVFGLISRERHAAVDVSLIIIDLDHFKSLNDQCGHKAGDEALCAISRHIRGAFHRKTDICCRYGGDEFVVILPKTSLEIACTMTEHLRQSVEQAYAREKVRVTLSCGVASKLMAPGEISELLRNAAGDEALGTVGQLLEVADQALYLSKERGRNQVTALPA